MSSITVSLIVFGCVFAGGLLGLFLHAALPEHHLSGDSKDAVKVGVGLVGTMAALVLGLLVASAKASYDAQGAQLIQLSANVVLLDRLLAHYGPETKEARDVLRERVTRFLEATWSKTSTASTGASPGSGEAIYDKIQGLLPKDDRQRSLQAQAWSLAMSLGQMRWMMYEQGTTSVSMPLLIVLVMWLTLIFGSFGLFAPANITVITSMCICAISVSAAIFLILEMYAPFSGTIQLSSAPVRAALAHLGQ
jgi:hypothetical protein